LGTQAFVDFQPPMTRQEVMLELLDGVAELIGPEPGQTARRFAPAL
jgi:hypothetical protein